MTDFFNTGLTQQQFLDEYWQKKPLLIRQALSNFESPISPEDLAGLACEAEVESRLIEENGPEGSWQVTHGPLSEDDFSRLPATNWTMLVQDVDKHLPELQYLLDPFRFIPDWRRDDLMISYAPKNGTVGPHTDGYDVFLLQAKGERRWQIGNKAIQNAELIEGVSLQILAEFSPDEEWDLEPGDMLYLPPHFAHHGVALNDCMTFSIGFRAPSQTDMLDAVINTLLERGLAKGRYADPDLKLSNYRNEIDKATTSRLKQLLHQTIDEAEPILVEALGKYVTETKSSLTTLAAESLADVITVDEIDEQFRLGGELQRNLYYRFAWNRALDNGQLFMAGEAYCVEGETACSHLPSLTEAEKVTYADWQHIKSDEQSANILCQLITEGGWYWAD